MASLNGKIPLLVLVACSFVLALHLTGEPVAGRRRQQDDVSVAWDRGEESDLYSDSQYEDSEEQEDQDIEIVNPDNLPCGKGRYDKAQWRPKFSDSSERILAGEPTRPGEHPFLVQLFKNASYAPHCGGVLVESDIVLTAAHCVTRLDKTESFVRLGVHETYGPLTDLQQRRVLNFITNSNYTPNFLKGWDISVIRIEDTKYKLEPNQDHGSINRICMPDRNTPYGPYTVVGWGSTSVLIDDGQPNITGMSPVPLQFEVESLVSTSESLLCSKVLAGNPSVLLGDSGGPLFRWLHPDGPEPRQAELVGLVSYLKHDKGYVNQNCYTNIMALKLWINRNIRIIR